MKKLVALLVISLMAASAFAVVDPDADMMGLYFDTNADVVCTSASFLNHVTAYIMLTNPTLSATRGFECKLSYVAADNNSSISAVLATPGTDVGQKTAPDFNFIAGFGVPLPTSPATILATLDIFYLTMGPMDLFMGPSVPSSSHIGLPMILREDFTEMNVGLSVLIGGPAAQINAPECSVVDSEDASFGAVKALFR